MHQGDGNFYRGFTGKYRMNKKIAAPEGAAIFYQFYGR